MFRTSTYWLIIAAILFAAVPGNGLMTFLVPVLGERGFTPANAATYLSVFTMVSAIGTIVGGFILDRIDTAKVSVPFTLCSVASFIILARISADHGGLMMLYVAAALFGFSFGAHRPMGQYFHTRFFGLRSFATVFAVQMALMALLFGIAAPVTGRIREATGSYDVVIWATVVGLAISALLYLCSALTGSRSTSERSRNRRPGPSSASRSTSLPSVVPRERDTRHRDQEAELACVELQVGPDGIGHLQRRTEVRVAQHDEAV